MLWIVTYVLSTLRLLADAAVGLLKKWGKLNEPLQCRCQNWVRGKVVIVTGANSGIGLSITRDLAKKGARVYLACRNPRAGEETARKLQKEAGNPDVHFLHLDLKDFTSIRAFADSFLKREQHLDALVNNAAVFHHPTGLTVNNIEITYQTNYLGAFLITNLLQNAILRAPDPRIVFVSSEAHKLASVEDLTTYQPREAKQLHTFLEHVKLYGISKLALHLFAQHLTESLPGVSVSLTNPGNVWTPIYRHSWRSWREVFTRLQCYIFMRDVEEGAQSTIHALNAPGLISGQYISSFLVGEKKQRYDPEVVQQLMADSALLTELPQSCLS